MKDIFSLCLGMIFLLACKRESVDNRTDCRLNRFIYDTPTQATPDTITYYFGVDGKIDSTISSLKFEDKYYFWSKDSLRVLTHFEVVRFCRTNY